MDRVIKFRAWDNETNKMIYKVMVVENLVYCLTDQDEKDYRLSRMDNAKLMQFTGLTDRNGKEIYEGDILGDVVTGYRMQVVYSKYISAFVSKGKYSEEALWETLKHCTVIGNLYENSDLLEGVK